MRHQLRLLGVGWGEGGVGGLLFPLRHALLPIRNCLGFPEMTGSLPECCRLLLGPTSHISGLQGEQKQSAEASSTFFSHVFLNKQFSLHQNLHELGGIHVRPHIVHMVIH